MKGYAIIKKKQSILFAIYAVKVLENILAVNIYFFILQHVHVYVLSSNTQGITANDNQSLCYQISKYGSSLVNGNLGFW